MLARRVLITPLLLAAPRVEQKYLDEVSRDEQLLTYYLQEWDELAKQGPVNQEQFEAFIKVFREKHDVKIKLSRNHMPNTKAISSVNPVVSSKLGLDLGPFSSSLDNVSVPVRFILCGCHMI